MDPSEKHQAPRLESTGQSDLKHAQFSIFHPHTIASIGVNGLLGTLRIPGFQIPDVGDGTGVHRKVNDEVHRILAWSARFKPLSGFRCFMMNGAMLVTHALGKREAQEIPAYRRPPVFLGEDGSPREVQTTICFLGSGLDQYRKPASAAQEYSALCKGLGCESSSVMYEYQSDWRSNTLTPAWFQRLYDAYRLNLDLNYFSKEAENFVKHILLSRVSQDGHKIDVEKAVTNMRFNFVGQSFGGTFCRMISNSLRNEMCALGYEPAEIQRVFDNVLVVNVSGASRAVAATKVPMFKEVYVEHVHDFICWQTDRSNVHPYFAKTNPTQRWIPVSERTFFLWSDFTWGEGQDQVARPQHDSYGFHTVQAMTKSPEMTKVATVLANANRCKNLLAPLKDLLELDS
jgi:hypothetical protein